MQRHSSTLLRSSLSPPLAQYHSSFSLPNHTTTSLAAVTRPSHASSGHHNRSRSRLSTNAQVPLASVPRYSSNQSLPSSASSSPMSICIPPRMDASFRTVYYLRDEAQTDKTVNQFRDVLKGHVGFDIEYRPTFQKGRPLRRTALIQLASASIALLVQVSAMSEFPSSIKAILRNPSIIKVGVGIQSDVQKLWDDYEVVVDGYLELGYLARAVDPQWSTSRGLISLARLAKAYQDIEFKKPKHIQMSNWELTLTEQQQDYAANDAFIALAIFDKLNTILRSLEHRPDKNTYIFSLL